uniref:Uncharacterized protein n=1 Tax=Siphoviridae sp. ctB3v5 TaxID=2826186 RepID=A0A8S5M977_9CAUD|nr:MAG TPA: hypothetical protein [Siphoviridae sp. ctB3v5]
MKEKTIFVGELRLLILFLLLEYLKLMLLSIMQMKPKMI